MLRRLTNVVLAFCAFVWLSLPARSGLLIDPSDGVVLWRDNAGYDDAVIRSRPLGFDFIYFGGDAVSSIDVSTNGNLNFDGDSDYANERSPGSIARISPLWDDQEVVSGSGDSIVEKSLPGVYYSVTWTVHGQGNSANRQVFQVVLFGGALHLNGTDFMAGDIVFAYGQIGSSFVKGNATVALIAPDGGALIALPGTPEETGVLAYSEAGALPVGPGGYVHFRDAEGIGDYVVNAHVNRPPIARDDTLYTSGKKRMELDVLSNDTDLDGGAKTIVGVTQGALGQVTILGTGRLAYQPGIGFGGTDLFTYTMRDPHGLTSTARVMLLPFAAGRGTLDGLVTDAPEEEELEDSPPILTNEGSGYLKITLTSSGGFTGILRYSGLLFSLRGTFDTTGAYSVQLRNKIEGVPHTWNLRLQLDLAAEGNQLTGTIDDGEVSSVVSAGRTRFVAATFPAGEEGKYTVLLRPGESGEGPTGIGYGLLVVNKAGTAKLTGKLPEGTALSFSSTVKPDGTVPVYLPYAPQKNARAGSLFGLITFRDVPGVSDCDAALRWFRPEIGEDPGFSGDPILEGARYLAPAKNQRALALADTVRNGLVDVAGTFGHEITLTKANKVLVEDPSEENLALSFNAATGMLTGSFREPHPDKENVWLKRFVYGALLQKQKKAGGYFLNPDGGGAVMITPPEE